MKNILDKKLKIIISNQIANYDLNSNHLSYNKGTISKYRKNGYLTYDENYTMIGLVFMSDDIRTNRYGNAEILFFNDFKQEFGTWRIIKIIGNYLPFTHLENHLRTNEEYVCTIDERIR